MAVVLARRGRTGHDGVQLGRLVDGSRLRSCVSERKVEGTSPKQVPRSSDKGGLSSDTQKVWSLVDVEGVPGAGDRATCALRDAHDSR